MNKLLDRKQAAEYCHNLPLRYFNNQLRLGNGPAFVRISPKRIYFQDVDLDAWMETWEHETPRKDRA
jgi:hypothetical protein